MKPPIVDSKPPQPPAEERKKKDRPSWAAYSTVGLMFPASIAVGLGMGYFLDEIFHTSPILIIIFTLYGVAAGFVNLFKVAQKNGKKR